MKKQFVRVLSFMMALMMVVATFGTVAVFAAADACDHSSDKVKTFVHDPQCNAIGFTSNVCECGYTWTSDIKAKVECVGEPVNATEATCTEPAYTAGEQCKWCGEIISGCEPDGEPLGHDMAYVTVDATCTQINEIVYGCKNCDYTEDVYLPDVIAPEEPDGHDFVYEIVTRPSCELEEVTATTPGAYLVKGSTTIYTTDDAVQVVVNGVISAKYYIVVTTNGTAKYACTDCDRTYTEIVVKWNDTLHVWEDKEYGEDTCEGTHYAWTECSVCGMYKDETLVATNDVVHEWATATEEEFAAWLEANPEAEIEVPYLDSTCGAAGHNLLYCPNCENYDLDTINTKPHDYKTATEEQFKAWLEANPDAEITAPYVASTCSVEGHNLKYCAGCEDYELETLALAAHVKGELVNGFAPTCTQWGQYNYDCPNCDAYYVVDENSTNEEELNMVKPLGHLYDLVKVVEPTCTEDGYTIYGCTRCDKAYIEAKEYYYGEGYEAALEEYLAEKLEIAQGAYEANYTVHYNANWSTSAQYQAEKATQQQAYMDANGTADIAGWQYDETLPSAVAALAAFRAEWEEANPFEELYDEDSLTAEFEENYAEFEFTGEFTELKREAGETATGHSFTYYCDECDECADCTHAGRTAYCTVCEYEEEAAYEAHDWADEITYLYKNNDGEFVIFEDYEEGDKLCDRILHAYVFCTRDDCECKEARPESNISAAGKDDPNANHFWKIMEGADHADPDCVNDGWVTITCDLCNISVSSLNNIYGVDVCDYSHEGDCSANGVIVEGCWKAYGHNHVIADDATSEVEIEATCLTPGYRPGKVCEHCECALCDVESEEHAQYTEINGELDPTNHDEDCVVVEIREVAPTCMQDGYNYVHRSCYGEGVFKPANPAIDVYPEGHEKAGQPIPTTLPANPDHHAKITADNGGSVTSNVTGIGDIFNEYKAPTCVATGNEAYYTCAYCGAYIVTTENGEELADEEWYTTDEIPVIAIDPNNHADLEEYVEYNAPKCLESGNKGYTHCAACDMYIVATDEEGNRLNATYMTEELPELDPTYHVGTVVEVEGVRETCYEIGWTYYAFCTACTAENEAEVLEYEREADKIYHYTSETDDKYCFATKGIVFVTKDGDVWAISTSSNNLYRPIPAHGTDNRVTVSEEDAVAPTCKTPGLAAGEYCKLCDGEYIGKNWDETTLYSENSPFYVAPLGHDSETVHDDVYGQWDSISFTETCEGEDVYCCEKYECTAYWCVWCHDMEALAWDEVEYEFNEDGTYAVELDENGDASWFIEVDYFANGHVWAEDKKLPTCTEDGYTFNYCENCACIEITGKLESKGHGYMNGDNWVELDLTCKNPNLEDVFGITCDTCGNLSADDVQHNWAHIVIEETCLEDGLEFWHCTWCFEYAIENDEGELEATERENAEQIIDEITPDEHIFGSIVPDSYVAPTTTSAGSVEYVCERCGETVAVEIPMLDGSLNVQILPNTYDVANGDIVEISIVLNSNYEEGFEFSAMELYFPYNQYMLEFVGYTVDHDDTVATEVASVDPLLGGYNYVNVISYATEESLLVTDDMAYVTLTFKVTGAMPFYGSYIGEEYEPAWFLFEDGYAYDENGEYMYDIEFTSYNDDVDEIHPISDSEYENGINFGSGVVFFPDLTGDIDYNGRIDTGDLVAFRDIIKSKEYDNVADINKDGVVNGADIVLLKKFLASNRTYADYQAMMGVDWWAEFEAVAEENLSFINMLLDSRDISYLKDFIGAYLEIVDEFEIYEEDAQVLASILVSIRDEITLEQFMTAAQYISILLEEFGACEYAYSTEYAIESLTTIVLAYIVNGSFME